MFYQVLPLNLFGAMNTQKLTIIQYTTVTFSLKQSSLKQSLLGGEGDRRKVIV